VIQEHRLGTKMSTCLGAISLIFCLAACGRPAPSAGSTVRGPTGTTSLPSDGWKPGDAAELALTRGSFHAAMTPSGPCAWLGSNPRPFMWPAGYGVRFNPTELVDGQGRVVASDGQTVTFGGGGRPAPPGTPCASAGDWTRYVQSGPIAPTP
jgi:hypothetical protein